MIFYFHPIFGLQYSSNKEFKKTKSDISVFKSRRKIIPLWILLDQYGIMPYSPTPIISNF